MRHAQDTSILMHGCPFNGLRVVPAGRSRPDRLGRWLYALAVGLLLLVLLAIAGPASAIAPGASASDRDFERAVEQVRRALAPRRDGAHLQALGAIRHLQDPSTRPFFQRLLDHEEWYIRVHAMLALAELSSEDAIDPAAVSRLPSVGQQALVTSALDSGAMSLERARLLIDEADLVPMARLLLLAELVSADAEPIDDALLATLADDPDDRIAALASLLRLEIGESGAWAAMRVRLDADRRRAGVIMPWLFEAVRQYGITTAAEWIRQEVRAADEHTGDHQVRAHNGLMALMAIDPAGSIDVWRERLGGNPSYAQRVRFGVILLAAGPGAPMEAWDAVEGGEPLAAAIARVGRAVSAGDDPAEPMVALIDLGHRRSLEWVGSVVGDLEPAAAARVAGRLLRRLDQDERVGGDDLARGIRAAGLLFTIDRERFADALERSDADGLARQAMLLGLLEQPDEAAAGMAQRVQRAGFGRTASLVALVIARHTEAGAVDEDVLRHLAVIAAGGGRVSDELRVQGAWLSIKHRGKVDEVIEMVFEP